MDETLSNTSTRPLRKAYLSGSIKLGSQTKKAVTNCHCFRRGKKIDI